MIARTPEEYEIFTMMDEERYAQEGRDRRLQEIVIRMPHIDLDTVNYRLM